MERKREGQRGRLGTGWAGALLLAAVVAITGAAVAGDPPPGEAPALGDRITQEQITSGELSLLEIRREGRRVFSTPFNRYDGLGDGPGVNPEDPISPGGRPTLQNNGMFLRVNGLDGQSCLECHGLLSTATIPARFGVGGAGGVVSSALAGPREIDVSDGRGLGFAFFDGRFINPPFVFGSGGVELLGKEMTEELQAKKRQAKENPGVDIPLVTKGVDFGVLRFEKGEFDFSRVEGVDHDLVVKPFGRKGEFISVRAFDLGALRFHFGMEPIEIVGEGVDADEDGVVDEVTVGEVSVMHVFETMIESPRVEVTPEVRAGLRVFREIGCADCHKPVLKTRRSELTYSFPEVPEEPFTNGYFQVDLREAPASFDPRPNRPGLVVKLFADLKRHDMGPDLAESSGGELDSLFTTARLWGVADTGPYLHDGRASTLTEAILLHGGEAQASRDAFEFLPAEDRVKVLTLLRALRTPETVGEDLDP